MPTDSALQPASVTEKLCERLAREINAAGREQAASRLLDWTGCVLAARYSPLASVLKRYAASQPPGEHLALGLGRFDRCTAILWNGALGNVLEMDDLHRGSILHAGPVVVPAALAAAQSTTVTGSALLDSIVRGYEATIRVGRAIGRSHYRYWHATSTCGAFGAAAAAGSILQLSRQQSVWALGNAGTRTGGLWQLMHEDVMSKSLHNAEAARSGLLAADLASAGFNGPRRILEGPQGLFMATSVDANAELVFSDDSDWLIHEVSVKPWPACRHVHAAIDAARKAIGDPLLASQIESVRIETYDEAIRFCDKPMPTTPPEARFSLQHSVAVALTRARPVLADFDIDALEDPLVADLRTRITTMVDSQFSAAFPRHYGARVTVTLRDGTSRIATIDDAWGDPEWPLNHAAQRQRAINLMQWGRVDARDAERLADATLELALADDEKALATWFELITECGQ